METVNSHSHDHRELKRMVLTALALLLIIALLLAALLVTATKHYNLHKDHFKGPDTGIPMGPRGGGQNPMMPPPHLRPGNPKGSNGGQRAPGTEEGLGGRDPRVRPGPDDTY